MNYCGINMPNKATCECSLDLGKKYDRNILTVCPAGFACAFVNSDLRCLPQCSPDQYGPCACRQSASSTTIAYTSENQVCMLIGIIYEPMPKIEVGERALEYVGCTAPGMQSIRCYQRNTCMLRKEKLECLFKCRSDSTALFTCRCISSDLESGPTASAGYFCSANGDTYAVRTICTPNSVSNGGCKCKTGDEECGRGSYCVESAGVQKCFPPCDKSFVPAEGAKCVCGTFPALTLLDSSETCAYLLPDAFEFVLAEPCADNQIGPCACYDMSVADSNFNVQFVDASHVCMLIDGVVDVKKLVKLGDACVDNACQTTIASPKTAVLCKPGQWCGATGPDSATVGVRCPYDAVLASPCMCFSTVKDERTFAASTRICKRNGVVSSRTQPGICGADVISDGNCRCNASDAQNCPSGHACAKTPENALECVKTCQPNVPSTVNLCACPTRSGMALLAKNAICACFDHELNYCETAEICAENKFGPCLCQNAAEYTYTPPYNACMRDTLSNTVQMQCRAGFRLEEDCACRKNAAGDAQMAEKNTQACVVKTTTENVVLPTCGLGEDQLTRDHACRVTEGGAVEFCATGSVCKAADATWKFGICVKGCSADADCSDNGKCVDGNVGKHCVAQCGADDHIVIQSVGCFCGSDICPYASACVTVGNAKKCVEKQCWFNTPSAEDCFCLLDGSGFTLHAAQYTPATHLCFETDHITRVRKVLQQCKVNALAAECICDTAEGMIFCGEKACAVGSGAAKDFCADMCVAGDQIVSESVVCTCGNSVCALGSACVTAEGAKKCVAKECAVNAVNAESCFCRLDGSGSGTGSASKAAQYTPTTHVCVETDPTTRAREVLPKCTADAPVQGCLCNTAGGFVTCGEKTCAVGSANVKDACADECADGKVSAVCACGGRFCAVGKTCKSGTCSKDGLSGGAIAGIVIAALVVVGGAAAGIFFALRAVKAKKAAQDKQNTVQYLEPRTIVPAAPPVE